MTSVTKRRIEPTGLPALRHAIDRLHQKKQKVLAEPCAPDWQRFQLRLITRALRELCGLYQAELAMQGMTQDEAKRRAEAAGG